MRVGAGFSPRSIPGLVAWWDASDAATVWADAVGTIAAPGGIVRCWVDKVSGVKADQPTGSYQPTLVNGGIGARSIQFGGLHALDVPVLPAVRCAVIVHRMNTGTRAALVGAYPGINQNWEVYNAARFFWMGTDAYSASQHATGAALVTSWTSGALGVPGGWGFYKNGVADGTVTAPATDVTSVPWRIGADYRNANPALAIPLNGYLAEIALFSATPSASYLAALHAYLISKWSVV